MDSRERMLAVFNGEIPDRVPIMELDVNSKIIAQHYGGDYGSPFEVTKLKWLQRIPGWRNLMRSFLIKPESYIKLFRELVILFRKMKLDAVCIPLCMLPIRNLDKKKKIGGKPAINFTIPEWATYVDEYGRLNKLIPTKYGFEVLFYVDGVLTSEDLFNEWGSMMEMDYQPMRMQIYEAGFKAAKNDDGSFAVMPVAGVVGINEPTWQALGLKFFSYCLRKKRSFLERVLDDRKLFAIEMLKEVADHGAELAVLYDDLGYKTGPIVNPTVFRELYVPRYKEITAAAHKKGLKIIMHSCGNLNELWDDLKTIGIDGIHPLEPTAKMDIFSLKKATPNLVFIGNVSPQDLQDKTSDEIRAYTTRLMAECKEGGRCILSSGHSIGPATTLENYLAMREIHEKYAKY